MRYTYKTTGTCSNKIDIDIEDNIIKDVNFAGGCDGNAKGISAIVKGMSINDVIDKLKGIRCGRRSTSCPDQLAIALEKIKYNS